MKNLKIFFLSALVATAGLFTACTEDNDWAAGELAEGPQAYFSADVQTSYTVGAEDTSVTLPVLRIDEAGALDVPVLLTVAEENAGLFTAPSSVVFNDGEKSASVAVSFDYAALTPGSSYAVQLTLDDPTMTTPYGNSQVTLTIVVPEPYVLLGKALYRDDIVPSAYNLGGFPEYYVEVYENTNMPGYIFMKNAYTKVYPVTGLAAIASEDVYTAIHIADPTKVLIPKQDLGVDVGGDGNMIIGTAAYGKLEDKIITFPVEGLLIAETNYKDGAWFAYGNAHGMFRLALPGAVLTDFSMEAAYSGFRAMNTGETFPIVAVATGADTDVAGAAYTFVAGDVSDDFATVAAELVAAEEQDYVEFSEADGDYRYAECQSSVSLEGGQVYTCVLVPYDANDEAQVEDAIAVAFYFPGVGATDAPECEVSAGMYYVSRLLPDYASQYPDTTSLIWMIEGVELKEIVLAGFFLTAQIDQMYETYVTSGQMTEEVFYDTLIAQYGDVLPDVYMDEMAEYGYTFDIVAELDPGTGYTGLVKATNIYGSVGYARMDGVTKTAEADVATLNGKGALLYQKEFTKNYKPISIK